jgi:hypothetical protein
VIKKNVWRTADLYLLIKYGQHHMAHIHLRTAAIIVQLINNFQFSFKQKKKDNKHFPNLKAENKIVKKDNIFHM